MIFRRVKLIYCLQKGFQRQLRSVDVETFNTLL